MTGPAKDYSRAGFAARLGPEVMADIARQVAAAPELEPEQVDHLRRVFAQVPRTVPALPVRAA